MDLTLLLIELFLLIIFTYSIALALMSLLFGRTDSEKIALFVEKFAIIIPSYKEGGVLLHNVESIKKQNYPSDKYEIFIINDRCELSVIEKLRSTGVKIIDVEFNRSSKVKSLQAAEKYIGDEFDSVIVLDADNLIHPNFLDEINLSLVNGNKIVQGKRIAKNLETNFSRLDSLTDTFYNFLDRYSPNRLKLSATISGSGFAVKKDLFFSVLKEINVFGGFDKAMQMILICSGYRIKFSPNALVYDEKVSTSAEFIKQRRRWLFAHAKMIFKHSISIMRSLLTDFNLDKLNLLFIQLRPPLTTIILFTLSFILYNFISGFYIMALLWLSVLISYGFFLILTMILDKSNIKIYFTLFTTPILFANHFLSLFGIYKASGDSLHTSHSSLRKIEEILSVEKR